jgi:flagellar hook-associated protein 1
MGTNILGIGQSALAAAQMGISVTGHNISNANVPGYNRQTILQAARAPQNLGGSFIGQGTEITGIQRTYSEYLSQQVNLATTNKYQIESYFSQISPINNLVADASAGVSPALQDFFKSVQDVANSPNATAGAAARQAALSSAQSMVGRINGLQGKLDQIGIDVNNQITTSVGTINTYATEIARLNDVIQKAMAATDNAPPNDLLDQRDQLVTKLSEITKVTTVKQDNSYNIFIGNGQPMVVGTSAYSMQAASSPTDPTRTEIAYTANGNTIVLGEGALPGGQLGGLFEFRSNTLDLARNSLGRMAIGIASTFNAQHRLGQDLNGQLGGDFFKVSGPVVTSSTNNTGAVTIGSGTPATIPAGSAQIQANITNVGALTTSDYRLQYLGGNFKVTRMSDSTTSIAASLPINMDGISFDLVQAAPPAVPVVPNNGDEFLIRPTAVGATSLTVAITDTSKIAAATPVNTNVPTTNVGTGKISSGVVDGAYTATSLTQTVPVTYNAGAYTGFPVGSNVTVVNAGVSTSYGPYVASTPVPYAAGSTVYFNGASFQAPAAPVNGDVINVQVPEVQLTFSNGAFTGFPAGSDVKVTNNGVTTTYAAYVPNTPVTYANGATINFNGVSFQVTGAPSNGDVFKIAPNTSGTGDNRNAVLLAGLQTKNSLIGNTTSYQGAYAQFVSLIGNKTHELEVSNAAEGKLLEESINAQQAVSGVNLDEEAANLLRYQQAYQAAGKLMQVASQLFDVLLGLGGR